MAGEAVGGALSLEVGPRALTHWRVGDAAEEKLHGCGRVDNLLLEMFLPADRSGRGDSKGGVYGLKQRRMKFFSVVEVI